MNRTLLKRMPWIMPWTAVLLLAAAPTLRAGTLPSPAQAIAQRVLRAELEELTALSARSPDAAARLIDELGEAAGEQFLTRLAPEAIEWLAAHGERGARFYLALGDAATPLCRKHGSDVLAVFDGAGPAARDWISRYGDDGVRLAAQMGTDRVEKLASKIGTEGLSVAARGGPSVAAQLERYGANHPELVAAFRQAIAESSERTLVDAIEKGGERFLQFLQRNWKGAALAAVCAAFFIQPEQFTEPAAELTGRLGEKMLDGIFHPRSVTGALLAYAVFGVPVLFGLWLLWGRRGAACQKS